VLLLQFLNLGVFLLQFALELLLALLEPLQALLDRGIRCG